MDNQNDIIDEVINLEAEEAEEKTSSVSISPDVVASIAGITASETDGVFGMCNTFAGGIAEILGKKNNSKGIKVEMKDNTVVIDMFIIVDYGIRIPELSWELQESVKNNVETMTGLDVLKVNIHIDGVSFKRSETEEKQRQNQAEEPEIIVEEADIAQAPEEDEFNL